jgi:hypothetical protein
MKQLLATLALGFTLLGATPAPSATPAPAAAQQSKLPTGFVVLCSKLTGGEGSPRTLMPTPNGLLILDCTTHVFIVDPASWTPIR